MLKVSLISVCLGLSCGALSSGAQQDSSLRVNMAGVIGRSDIVLGQPNLQSDNAMPLGNGRLGIAVWSADGMTLQLNRGDTLPRRYSTGQVVIPALSELTSAKDYMGRLNLYDGTFEESGGGMTARVWVQEASDTVIVDVNGADPAKLQTALLKLWEPRTPKATAHGAVGLLAQSWLDNEDPGASNSRFGALSAITVEGTEASATISDGRTVAVTFRPDSHGHYRVIVASPHYDGDKGSNTAERIATQALAHRNPQEHLQWWHDYWQRARFMKISSPDGVGEYMENLRAIYLFSAAAESKGTFPGSQAGVADLFSAAGDAHQWDSAAFWHWNLRMQVAANLGAGLADLNSPYFRLYRQNLANIERWTRDHMKGAPGICIPETMRFNGAGIEHESWVGKNNQVSGWNCDLSSTPYYNARTLSTGAEVSLWIWKQYLNTGDRSFLESNFPVMAESARFLLSYEKAGPDGLRHTSPSNAHENQWDTMDPTTDLSARKALYAATIKAASLLGKEPGLIRQMQTAIEKIPAWPRVQPEKPTMLVEPKDASNSTDVIANSYRPADEIHNVENIGLEPVWPYDLIGDISPLFSLAKRTYAARPNKANIDWCYDPVQAARLGLGSEVGTTLTQITQANQRYINGFAKWGGDGKEFYVEQIGMVALALQEALVQDYDGMIRIAPAIPPKWNFDGSVAVRKGTSVAVQVRDGEVTKVVIDVRQSQKLLIRSPWAGETVEVIAVRTGKAVVAASNDGVISFTATAGNRYRLLRTHHESKDASWVVSGVPASNYRKLGAVQIGLAAVQ